MTEWLRTMRPSQMLTPILKYLSYVAYQFTQHYHPEYPAEFFLPQIRKHIVLEEFPFIAARRDNPTWPEAALRAKIQELGPWEYYLEFSQEVTTKIAGTFNERTIDFHRFRSKLISETVADLLGDDLGQATVLDLACHCGVFSLDLAFRGARSVRGIEVRPINLQQAKFLKDYYRIENVIFELGDVDQLPAGLQADVILGLGILYHIVRPVDFIEFCYRSARRFAVIETLCHKQPISAYHLVRGRNTEVAIEGTRPIELLPTYRAVIDTMRAVGFKDIVEVIGISDMPVELFADYTRRCFIGLKEPPPRPLETSLVARQI